MNFVCPTCGEEISHDLLVIIPHTEKHIIDEIKKKKPKWVENDGTCKKCYAYFKDQMKH